MIAHSLNNINQFFNRNIRIDVCNVTGNTFYICIIWDFKEIIKIKCVMLFILKTWGSGKYDSRLLAITLIYSQKLALMKLVFYDYFVGAEHEYDIKNCCLALVLKI